MHRQVGDLALDATGIAERGLLVRHLVMPDRLAGTASVMPFLGREISRNTYVNVMDQYHACGQAVGKPRLGRCITRQEFAEALDAARQAGLWRLDERHKHWLNLEL
jgi:putative pyruvate formate lyase activating enzyme